MKIHCTDTVLVPVKDLKPHPKNRNKHSEEQIERLAKILEYQGWRYPIKVSKLSGFITSGHGRLEAAKLLKIENVPVSFQEYENSDQEYADVQSDNAIASWSELDLPEINKDVAELNHDFDFELLGIKYFSVEPMGKFEMQYELRDDLNKKYILEVTFPNEMELADIRDDLLSRGYIVKEKNK